MALSLSDKNMANELSEQMMDVFMNFRGVYCIGGDEPKWSC